MNKPWKVHKRWPNFTAMPKMLKELEIAPAETGFLGHTGLSMRTSVQYLRTFEHLEQYARSGDKLHWPAWVEFNRRMKNSRRDVGRPRSAKPMDHTASEIEAMMVAAAAGSAIGGIAIAPSPVDCES